MLRVLLPVAALLLFLASAQAQSSGGSGGSGSSYSMYVNSMATADDSTYTGTVAVGADFGCLYSDTIDPGTGVVVCQAYGALDLSDTSSSGSATPAANIYNQFKENTHFGNPPQNQVSRYTGTFEIPDAPYSNNGEVLFVMMAMKNNDDSTGEKPFAGVVAMYNQGSSDTQTLGRSGEWTVFSWFQRSGTNAQLIVSFPDETVTSGAVINVDILYTEDNDGTVAISSQSSTGGSTSLNVQEIPQGFNIIQDVLSAWYATSDCNNYMPASAISFWNLSAKSCNLDDCSTSTAVSLSWSYANPAGSVCGNNKNLGSSTWHNLGPYSV